MRLLTALVACFFGLALSAAAQEPTAKEADAWRATAPLPPVCVVKLNAQATPATLSILIPIPAIRERTETYVVEKPVVVDDKTVLVSETRQRVVAETTYVMQRRDAPLADVVLLTLEGEAVPADALAKRLEKPLRVLYGVRPDAYLRAILRDDLLVLMPVKGKQLPAPLPPAPPPVPTQP